jgi:hypothetical protein
MGYDLNFDAAGQPIGKANDRPQPGPLTLSGIEVKDVSVKGSKLVLHAERVALVADAQGVLERRPLISTTLMFGTVQKQYRAKEALKITIQADAGGSFDSPLRAVFANGLAELSASAPRAWRCYAKAYLGAGADANSPASVLDACIDAAREGAPPADAPPTLLTQPQPRGTRQAAELHVAGVSEVYILVDAHGVPIDYQVVHPLGAGLDEDTLEALSHCRFAPGTRGGLPVVAGIHFSMQYR